MASLESAKLKDELGKAKKLIRGKASDFTLIGDPMLLDFIPNRYEEPEVPKPHVTILQPFTLLSSLRTRSPKSRP
jgi:hypothetical protein